MPKSNILLISLLVIFSHVFSQDKENGLNHYIRSHTFDKDGKEIVGIIVPGVPPADGHREPVAIPTRSAVLLNWVPAFSWSFGCSATSASMAAGYYDNNGYPNMYAGPTNWGFMPMDNSCWGTVVINAETRAQCPLSATRNTVDGRTSRGHVDDYWIVTNNAGPDPFIVNNWTEHTYGECTADYMGTNQSALGNVDGGTTFYNYTDGSPIYNYTACEPGGRDGCHGLRDFFESRGYTVVQNYSQYIYGWQGNTLGFTFNQYKQEINNGRPVLIQVEGHTMLGFGYDDTGSLVYLHDTWDYSNHTMVWGGTYAGMAHYGVTVVQLSPSTAGIVANYSASDTLPLINTTVNFTDLTWGTPNSWTWTITPGTFSYVGGTSASSEYPQVQFTAGGNYTITLTASNGSHTDSEVKTNYIRAVDCNNFSLPLSEDLSDGHLPSCWENIDHAGNGQAWQFNNPGNRTINTSTSANGFAILDSDHYGDGSSQDADLVSPVLNFSEYAYITLSFQHYFREFGDSHGTLSYSINGGSTWTTIQTWSTETANAATFSQNLSSQVAGQANVRFKWNYVGTWAYYWAIDDISITATAPGLWKGYTSSNWNTASNWDDGVVPADTTNVTIASTAAHWPSITGNFSVGTQCKNLTIPANALMTVAGNFTINAGKSLTFSGAGELNISGNWTKNGTFTPGSGTVTFSGSNPSTVNFNGTISDITTYSRSTFPKNFIHLTDSIIGPQGDNASMNVPLVFTFNYLGTNYDSARICTNGWISLNKSGTTEPLNQNLFTATAPNTSLAPWWDDLKDDNISFVSYKTLGSTPNRVFTVEWHRILTYYTGTSARITFQVKLFETTNIIEFQYGNYNASTPNASESASIGIEDATGGSNHFIEATTGSTTTGVSNLKANLNWPTVNYRFTPPVTTESFNNLKISKTGGSQVSFNCNVNVAGTLTVNPGASVTITSPRTISVNGY
jgi:hypothetical protein